LKPFSQVKTFQLEDLLYNPSELHTKVDSNTEDSLSQQTRFSKNNFENSQKCCTTEIVSIVLVNWYGFLS